MELASLQPLIANAIQTGKISETPNLDKNASFQEALTTALSGVNEAQLASQAATKALARKEPIDLHEVMITANKASISMQATLEVRNKAVEAYQEMMRMQV